MPFLPFLFGNGHEEFEQFEERILAKRPGKQRYHKSRRLEDDYTVLTDCLGGGMNGVVRKAMRKDQTAASPQRYAVKTLKWSSVDARTRPMIEREVAIFLEMDHPHVTTLYDVYGTEDGLHLVMECMEGGELFDRILELKVFEENTAAKTVYQMLLAVNYLHSENIVHLDLKLENFLYERRENDHLKLIDFGFSRHWHPKNKSLQAGCGTLSYVPPEMFEGRYSLKCDLWSLGVITYVLLGGALPFGGGNQDQDKTMQLILAGNYPMEPARWDRVSPQAREFVRQLLVVDPSRRLSAEAALGHPWIASRHEPVRAEADASLVDAFRSFAQASRFRRCCLEMLAWALTNDERAKVRQHFISMDKDHTGTITLVKLKEYLMKNYDIGDGEALQIFGALDSTNKEAICYSDFLAAMVSTRIKLHDQTLRDAFKNFDTDKAGYISKERIQDFLDVDAEEAERLMTEAHPMKDGKITYEDFVAYLRFDPYDKYSEQLVKVIDVKFRRGTKTWSPGSRIHLTRDFHNDTAGSSQFPRMLGKAQSYGGRDCRAEAAEAALRKASTSSRQGSRLKAVERAAPCCPWMGCLGLR